MAIGITPSQLAAMPGRGQISEGVAGLVSVQTVVGTATYNCWPAAGSPTAKRIVRIWGHCTDGAPGAGDTVVVQRVNSAGTVTAITDTADLNAMALADKSTFDYSTLDDAQWLLNKNDQLRVVTASDATCIVYVLYMNNAETN